METLSFPETCGEKVYAEHVKTFTRECLPQGNSPPKALIVLSHGFAEHSGKYVRLVNVLVKAGYAFFGHDHRFHGRSLDGPNSAGLRDFDELAAVLKERCLELRARFPATKLFIFAHSMGVTVATRALQLPYDESCGDKPDALFCDGVINDGPFIHCLAGETPEWQKRLVKAISGPLGWVGMIRLDAKGISHDEDAVADYLADPLVFRGMATIGFVGAVLRVFEQIDSQLDRIDSNVAMLTLHGTADAMCPVAGGKFVHDALTHVSDKEFYRIDDAMHQLHNETPEYRDKFEALLLDWLSRHV